MNTLTCELPLTQGKTAQCSPEDFEYLSQFKWYAVKQSTKEGFTWYARRGLPVSSGFKDKKVRMHLEIAKRMGLVLSPGQECDHRNLDGLDNRRENLRAATHAQNNQNKRKAPGKSSSYKGVSWFKRDSKWVDHMRINGKNTFLGYFDDEIEAAAWWAACDLFYHGAFACSEPLST